MSQSTLRRSGAFLASVGLLASLAVATVAAPASAGKCEPFTGSFPATPASCYYATGQINDALLEVPEGVTLNGTDADDTVGTVVFGGTFNGGSGNDSVARYANNGTFNGGPDNDYVSANLGTFNGGGGADGVTSNYGTFAGGGGSDCYGENTGTVWSADPGWWNGVCYLD